MPPQLIALTDGPNILLDKPILLLGRHQECDVQFGSRKVSRRHCCVAQVDNYVVVRDLGSTNGIRINGIRVLEGSLRPGDELTIGNQRYQLEWDSRAETPVPVVPSGRQAAKAAQPRAGDDLESCENPIPLPDRDQVVPIATAVPLAVLPPSPAPLNGIGATLQPPSPVVRDDLNLGGEV